MGAIRAKLLKQDHRPEAHKPIFNQLVSSNLIELVGANKTKEINAILFDILGAGFGYESLMRK
jgi:precorrin-2 dehydrogenase/sirohydrochlorin ferrochelatase